VMIQTLLAPVILELGKGHRHTEVYRRLRRNRSILAIEHRAWQCHQRKGWPNQLCEWEQRLFSDCSVPIQRIGLFDLLGFNNYLDAVLPNRFDEGTVVALILVGILNRELAYRVIKKAA